MRVNQVSVGNVVVKCLIAISDAFWYENCRARIDFVRENRAEAAKKRAIKDGLWKDPGEVKLPTTPIE